MSISSEPQPLNATCLRNFLNFSTDPESPGQNLPALTALFLLACGSTLSIWSTDPLPERIYECLVLSIAAWTLLRSSQGVSWQFALLPLWGGAQLVLGSTEYPYATLQTSLKLASLAATVWVAQASLTPARLPTLLHALAWFGFLLSIVSVLAYYTSPGQVLWLIPARYPDVWGPFLSRNNFAQLLEITFPVALWLALTRSTQLLYWSMAATMLAAGFASASRAGAVLLCLEALAMFLLAGHRIWHRAVLFCAAVLMLAVLAGAQTLLHRFTLNLVDGRAQIYQSSLAMISQRPWTGHGLGTFASVYPEFALFDSGYSIDHAHSDWLEWAAEGGVGFAALWAALFLPVVGKLREHPWALGLPSVLLHALVDFPMVRLGIATWIFFLIGALKSPQPFRRTS